MNFICVHLQAFLGAHSVIFGLFDLLDVQWYVGLDRIENDALLDWESCIEGFLPLQNYLNRTLMEARPEPSRQKSEFWKTPGRQP
jgi:hypothetical protein